MNKSQVLNYGLVLEGCTDWPDVLRRLNISGCVNIAGITFMEEHKKMSCVLRPATCEYCKDEVAIRDVTQHQSACTMFPQTCPNGCGLRMPRSEVEAHIDMQEGECQMKPCPFGCKESGKEHEKDSVLHHLLLLRQQLDDLGQSIMKQIDLDDKLCSLRDLQDEIEHLSQRFPPDHDYGQRCDNVTCRELDLTTVLLLEEKIKNLENEDTEKAQQIEENDQRIEELKNTSYDGTLIWRIEDMTRRIADATNGTAPFVVSCPFYTDRQGYKMCAKLYLNGDGIGKGTHVSLFLGVLLWPFRAKVTFSLLAQDQTGDVTKTYHPGDDVTACLRPLTAMNPSSGLVGFCPIARLASRSYVTDDVMFFKVAVDIIEL